MPAMPDQPLERAAQLHRLLSAGLASTDQLLQALSVSQPTLSRTIQAEAQARLFRLSGQRTPAYGLLRALPGGVAAEQKLFRILPSGAVRPAGELSLLQGDCSVWTSPGGSTQAGARSKAAAGRSTTTRFDGLPPALRHAAPAGFLGRQAVAQAQQQGLPVPAALRDWGDDHHAAYLFAVSTDLPGDLVFGEAALARELAARAQPALHPAQTLPGYLARARGSLAAPAGSLAGGEQPKFLARTRARGAVLVKYARQGSRWADLLALENLALAALRRAGQPAASARLLHAEDLVFLEVQRFDRVGDHGRRGLISAGALDDERWGHRDHWAAFAQRCVRERLLSRAAADTALVQAAFGELIGNSDRHFENLSLLLDEQGRPEAVAPAYDCLPMRYAPLGGGVNPELSPLQPRLAGHASDAAVWATAWAAARWFWAQVAEGAPGLPAGKAWRELGAANLRAGDAFVAPLAGGR